MGSVMQILQVSPFGTLWGLVVGLCYIKLGVLEMKLIILVLDPLVWFLCVN